MLTIRKAEERGRSELNWLKSAHTFSFSHYFDPRHMGFGKVRVINEDEVAPGGGFATHPHREMEIISYVLEGALEHKDSMGNGSIIRPGEVQRMSAGTGVTHSEFNHSGEEPVRFLQIWIVPDLTGYPPGYQQKRFETEGTRGALRLVASRNGRDGSVSLNQDVDMYVSRLDGEDSEIHDVGEGRSAWIQVAGGSVKVNNALLDTGDGAGIMGPAKLELTEGRASEVVVFDQTESA
jgi:redox-sensitive bicupin YhaK (pirin superfamily)